MKEFTLLVQVRNSAAERLIATRKSIWLIPGGSGQLGLEKKDFTHTPTLLPWTPNLNGCNPDLLELQTLAAGGYHSFVQCGQKVKGSLFWFLFIFIIRFCQGTDVTTAEVRQLRIPLINLTVTKIRELIRSSNFKQ